MVNNDRATEADYVVSAWAEHFERSVDHCRGNIFSITLPVRGADAVPSEATAPTCVETATKLDRNVISAAAEFEN